MRLWRWSYSRPRGERRRNVSLQARTLCEGSNSTIPSGRAVRITPQGSFGRWMHLGRDAVGPRP